MKSFSFASMRTLWRAFLASKRTVPVALILVLFFIALIPSVYFYTKYRTATSASRPESQAQLQQLIEKVGKHILLPAGEMPVIYTVTEQEKLSGQAFFANAENGDKVLVYERVKKAFLYSPKKDLVLEFGPVNINPTATVAAQSVTPTPQPMRFVLYNGTTTVGRTKSFETVLAEKVAGALVVDRDNAKSSEYKTSILVDITGTHPNAETVATSLGIPLGPLPEGEVKPEDSDFLLIIGEDKK